MLPSTSETYLYCRPGVLDTAEGAFAVDRILAEVAQELRVGTYGFLRRGSEATVVIKGAGPVEVWAAMDRVSDHRAQDQIFFVPAFGRHS